MAFWAHGIANQSDDDRDGIHLLWAPPRYAGYSLDGFDVWRRDHRVDDKPNCYSLTKADMALLTTRLRVSTPVADIGMRLTPCPVPPSEIPDEPIAREKKHEAVPQEIFKSLIDDPKARDVRRLMTRGNESATATLERALGRPAVIARSTTHFPQPVQCILYEFKLRRPCHHVRLRFRPAGGIALAFQEEKVVGAEVFMPAQNHWQVSFQREGIDRVLVWVARSAHAIEVCCRSRRDLKPGEGWQNAKLIAKNLQLPFRRVNPSVNNVPQEEGLATSRLFSNEALGPGQFTDLSETMNDAVRNQVSPIHMSSLVRETEEQTFIEIAPWAMGLSLSIDARWRRALALGILDKGDDLVENDHYDYRIVGRFRRRDIQERLLGFHTIPLGTPLPHSIYLDQVRIDFANEREVIAHPKVPTIGLVHPFRKGVEIRGKTTLTFPDPLTRVVLEFEANSVNMNYRALTGGVFIGIAQVVQSDALPQRRRVELDFPSPVLRLELNGRALLYGIRVQTVAKGTDAEDVIERDAYVTGIRYEKTVSPVAPPLLGTVNLQTPLPTGDPRITTQTAPNLIGFKLWWLPPASGNWPVGWWPSDVPAAPPTDVVGYDIQRRRIDNNGDWKPFDEDPKNGLSALVGSARTGTETPSQLRPGDDLLAHFPESKLPVPPVPLFSSLEDVLISLGDGKGPPPGSLHQYRIHSVDAIGRRSDQPTSGSVVQLQKRRPPPRPPGPPLDPANTQPAFRGVHAKLLQASDSTLSNHEVTLLGNRANAVLLKWGWTDEERRADRWATEFRLYWQSQPPDIIHGEFSGNANYSGGTYHLTAELTATVIENQFAGQFVKAGSHPFRVVGHASGIAGSPVVFRLAPSALAITPTPTPGVGRFVLRAELDGSELQPENWEERSHVIPITNATEYEWVFPHSLTLSAEQSRARAWVGVSAADDQDYIPDVIANTATNGGRPGNESSLVIAVVEGRWRGRPTLTVPPPLPNVPEIMIPEVPGDDVSHTVDLPGLLSSVSLPANHRVQLEHLSGADIVSTITALDDDTIRITQPDGTVTPYPIANPNDRAQMLAQIRTGEAARVENRFLLDIAIKMNAQGYSDYWQRALPTAIELAETSATVPNKAERYFYRVRAVDAANRASVGAAYVPRVFRVPSRRVPGVPQLLRLNPTGNAITVRLQTSLQFDLQGVLLFIQTNDVTSPPSPGKPDLLRIPNRPDLYPTDGIRLRLLDGAILAPTFHNTNAATQTGSVLTWEINRSAGYQQQVTAWATAITRDGVCSPVVGPLTTTTGQEPPVVPMLNVVRDGARDNASWAATATTSLVRLEGLLNATWTPMTPWLTHNQLSATVNHENGVRYRLRVISGQAESLGPEVTPA